VAWGEAEPPPGSPDLSAEAGRLPSLMRDGSTMAAIFLSYRREDSAGWAGDLCRTLQVTFGRKNVFIDNSITPGADFRKELEKKLASCNVLLAVIGPNWLSITRNRARRLKEQWTFPLRVEG
jgi:TIR domain